MRYLTEEQREEELARTLKTKKHMLMLLNELEDSLQILIDAALETSQQQVIANEEVYQFKYAVSTLYGTILNLTLGE